MTLRHQLLLSGFIVNAICPECHISRLMIRVIMGNLLAFTLRLRKTSARRQSDEVCVISHHLKWGPLPSNKVCRTAKHVRKRKGMKGEKDEE